MNYIANGLMKFVGLMDSILFYEIKGLPILMLCLMVAGLFFSFFLMFPAQKNFKKSIKNIINKDNSNDNTGILGNISSVVSSLTSIVGQGNVAGVAAAITTGGPGALFWMILMAFFGMNTSFAETLLACKYKAVNVKDKEVDCAPVTYIRESLKNLNFPTFGKILAVVYGILYPFGLVVGTILLQITDSTTLVANDIPFFANHKWILSLTVGLFIVYVASKGITGISKFFLKVQPWVIGSYFVCGIAVIICNVAKIPSVIIWILKGAFSIRSITGGILGAMVAGVKRGVYSNEAGLGASTTPYAASKGGKILEQAGLGSLNPFFDTICICFFTGLVVLLSGVYVPTGSNLEGGALVQQAISTTWEPLKYLFTLFNLCIAIVLAISSCFNANNVIRTVVNKKFMFLVSVAELILFTSTAFLDFGQALEAADTLYLSIMVPNLICLFLNAKNIKNIYNEEVKHNG